MPAEQDPRAIAVAIERQLEEVEALDPAARAGVQELVRLILAFHGTGLARILDVLGAVPGGDAALDRLRRDDVVSSLLALHDLPAAAAAAPLIQITRPDGTPAGTPPAERCDLCRTPLPSVHSHVADLESRRLLCACGACAATADPQRYRPVTRRQAHVPPIPLRAEDWDRLGIPVDLAFLFHNSTLGRMVACYPGAAGATESLLPLDAWPAILAANPQLAAPAPDVEALLVRKRDDAYHCLLVPIDACYALVGRIRAQWSGMSGGDTVRQLIDSAFDTLAGTAGEGQAA